MSTNIRSTSLTLAEAGHDGPVTHFASIGGDLVSLDVPVFRTATRPASAAAACLASRDPSRNLVLLLLRNRRGHLANNQDGLAPISTTDGKDATDGPRDRWRNRITLRDILFIREIRGSHSAGSSSVADFHDRPGGCVARALVCIF
jgi:hypothetical protein